MKPWFAWSPLVGIKPVHPKGWAATALAFLVTTPLGLIGIGTLRTPVLVQAICAVGFVAFALTFFCVVFWNMDRT